MALRKLGLSIRFPRNTLYARKYVLEVRLMPLSTVMGILALKSCVGRNEGESKIATII